MNEKADSKWLLEEMIQKRKRIINKINGEEKYHKEEIEKNLRLKKELEDEMFLMERKLKKILEKEIKK